jgi:carotenoid 1,2-hydratase
MTERGRQSMRRDADTFSIGPSAMAWREGTLAIDVNEMTVPLPGKLRGSIRLTPSTAVGQSFMLASDGLHHWRPAVPMARIEVAFQSPDLHWAGAAYHDMNWGAAPLERAFDSWVWARADTASGCHIVYDSILGTGKRQGFTLDIGRDGGIREGVLPERRDLPRGLWRMARPIAAAGSVKLRRTLEDSPFYMRSLVDVDLDGETVTAVHESLSLRRFDSRIVQMMLPFRMPRRA